MKQIIHINQHNIKYNKKHPEEELKPVITCKTYKDNVYYNTVEMIDKESGESLGKIVYSPHKTLSCGANVWIELDTEKVILKEVK